MISFLRDSFCFVAGLGLWKEQFLKGQVVDGMGNPWEVNPLQIRFTKADNGVITDSVTALIGTSAPMAITIGTSQAWTENLTVAGWLADATIPELKTLYQKGLPRQYGPLFQAKGWSGPDRCTTPGRPGASPSTAAW